MYNQNVELRHLRYFVAVAEELHFSRAAEKLQMAQPPLSQQIRQLEQALDVRLFVRNHHTVALTVAGQMFLEEARIILGQVDNALSRMQDVKRGLAGRLNIGYIGNTGSTDMLIPDILQIYRQRFPAVDVRLQDMDIQEQMQALQEQKIQLGFLTHAQKVVDELDCEIIERIPLVAVCAKEHRFASQSSIKVHTLRDEAFIFCHRQAARFFYDQIIRLCSFSPHIAQEVSDIRMLLGLVAANMGISIVPASAANIRQQGVVYIPFVELDAAPTIETILVWNRKEISPLIQEFLAVTREVLKQAEV